MPLAIPSPVQQVSLQLTAAQLLALQGTPVTILPAPGAGKMNVPISCTAQYVFGTGTFQAMGVSVGWAGAPVNNAADPMYGLKFSDGALGEQLANTIAVATFTDLNTTPQTSFLQTVGANKALVLSQNVGGDPITYTGTITTSALSAGGLAYAVNDTGTVFGAGTIGGVAGGTRATYVVNSIGAGGAVVTYTITNHDPAYATGVNNTVVTTGIGDGNFKINVTAIPAADGSVWYTLDYVTVTLH